MGALLLPGQWLAARLGLAADPHWWAIACGADAMLWLALLRTALVVVGRSTGLYHPAFYRWCPRLPWRTTTNQ